MRRAGNGSIVVFLLGMLLKLLQLVFSLLRKAHRAGEHLMRALGWNPRVSAPRRPHWYNSVRNQFSVPAHLERPSTFEDLVAIVTRAASEGRCARAVGAGHSSSDVAVTDDYLVNMHGLCAELPLDISVLRTSAEPSTLHTVESGVRIRELNQQLAQRHLALLNMGSYDVQTISGAISTATHGSGHALGPLCDAVQSLVLVHGQGRVTRIEPSEGITDPSAYRSKYPNGPELVQDDDLFYSVVVSMGSLGIVAAYTLRVRPAFLLKESRALRRWTEVRAELLNGVPSSVEHYELYVNPYPVKGEYWCLVTERSETTQPAHNDKERARNPLTTLLTRFRFIDWVLRRMFSSLPFSSPVFIQYALKALVDAEYIDQSYRVFNLGDANLVPAISAEFAFDTSPVGGSAAHVAGIEKILQLATEQADIGNWHTSPFGVRFVRASRHHLAPQYGRDSCMVELPFMLGTAGAWDLLRYYERRLVPDGVRPHWGQANFSLSYESTLAAYAEFPKFLHAFAHFNPDGTFDNVFTQRLSLRAASRTRGAQPA
jgi:hypothetical protein